MLFNNIVTERLILKNISIEDRNFILAEKLGFVISGSSYELFRNKEYLHNVYSLYLPELT